MFSMAEIVASSSGLLYVPDILLTSAAFDMARRDGIVSIEPNPSGMEAIAEITQAPRMPDITLLRVHGRGQREWDQTFQFAASDFPYIPAQALKSEDNPTCSIRAADIRTFAHITGKTILDLVVKEWTTLGATLATAIEEAKLQSPGRSHEAGGQVTNAYGALVGNIIKSSAVLSSSRQRIDQATRHQPYHIIQR